MKNFENFSKFTNNLCFSSKGAKNYRIVYSIFLKNKLKECIFAIFLTSLLKISNILRRPGCSTPAHPRGRPNKVFPPESKSWRHRWIPYLILLMKLLATELFQKRCNEELFPVKMCPLPIPILRIQSKFGLDSQSNKDVL